MSPDGQVEETQLVHETDNGTYYCSKRVKGSNQYERVVVKRSQVYELTRRYRRNKANPSLVHMIASVQGKDKNQMEKFFVSSYKLDIENDENLDECFVVPRHGNSSKPLACPYYRTDKSVLENASFALDVGKNCDSIYREYSSSSMNSVSEELRNPKQV